MEIRENLAREALTVNVALAAGYTVLSYAVMHVAMDLFCELDADCNKEQIGNANRPLSLAVAAVTASLVQGISLILVARFAEMIMVMNQQIAAHQRDVAGQGRIGLGILRFFNESQGFLRAVAAQAIC